MEEMNMRERFHAVMRFQPTDQLPVIEWAPYWNQTVRRWQEEGLKAADCYEIYDHFGLDMIRRLTCRARDPAKSPKPPRHGAGLIKDMDEYRGFLRHLYPEDVVTDEWKPFIHEQRENKCILRLLLDGYFGFPRSLLGIERHLFAFYDQKDLMHRINSDLVDWQLRMLDRVLHVCIPDFVTFAEDMSYNHGPMISKELFDEFMLPYYKRIMRRFSGLPTVSIVDSDGDVTVPAAWFAEAGVDGILPLERQAGVDISALRKRYPRMAFIGHYDKMVMDKGERAMRKEFERLLPAAREGGFIFSVDHQTPPSVSLEDYHLYVRLLKEYAPLAATG